ncbi:hypothetical protein MY3296_010224, partial [Beauveria thailandica]
MARYLRRGIITMDGPIRTFTTSSTFPQSLRQMMKPLPATVLISLSYLCPRQEQASVNVIIGQYAYVQLQPTGNTPPRPAQLSIVHYFILFPSYSGNSL